MSYEPMNRRLATLAAVFAFVGVLIGVIALATNYWSYNSTLMLNDDGTYITQGRTDNDTWNVRLPQRVAVNCPLCSLTKQCKSTSIIF